MKGEEHDLHRQARNLPVEERLLLQLAAILYEPVSASFLCRSFVALDPLLPGERRIKMEEIGAMIVRLRQQGFLNEKNQCPPVLAELLLRDAISLKRFSRIAALVERSAPADYQHGRWPVRCWRALRQFRIGVYSHDGERIEQALQCLQQHECRQLFSGLSPAAQVLTCAFDPEWFSRIPLSLQFLLVDYVIVEACTWMHPIPELLFYLRNQLPQMIAEEEQIPFQRMLASIWLVQGERQALAELMAARPAIFVASGVSGALAFLSGELEKAGQLFSQDLESLRRYAGEQAFFIGLPAILALLQALARGNEADQLLVEQALMVVRERSAGDKEELLFDCIQALAEYRRGKMPDLLALSRQLAQEERLLPLLISMLALYWLGVEIAPEYCHKLKALADYAQKNGYFWVAGQAQFLVQAVQALPEQDSSAPTLTEGKPDELALISLFAPAASWKHSLSDLIEAINSIRPSTEGTFRLCWLVDYHQGRLQLFPREQRRGSSGLWTKGRSIALARLAAMDLPYLSERDKHICASLYLHKEEGGATETYLFDQEKALLALVGHPLVFLKKSPSTPVEVVAVEPELMMERRNESLFLSFSHEIGPESVSLRQETPTRFNVVQIREEHRRVAEITGRHGLQVPLEASAEVLAAIGNIASFMTVHSAIEVPQIGAEVELVPSDSTIHMHIIPYGGGFRIELFVRPFAPYGPYLKPGAGATNLFAEINGRRLRTRRDLHLEEDKARQVEESCPMLDLATDFQEGNRREWHMLDPEECLQVLLEIEAIRDQLVLEWPEGEKLSVRRQAGLNQLNLNIRTSHQDWFALSGQLRIDQDEVLELKTLLEKVRETRSRFIPMGEGQFLALTQEFRNRLDELLCYGAPDGDEGNEIKVHALAARALEELSRQAQTQTDKGWRERLKAIDSVSNLSPKPPNTLKAELRDYQREGFVWMSRLAHLGLGACLADDMGLGKTLQGVAMILAQAQHGPSLVVAPTSVCMNWLAEINRFAPTLHFHLFSETNREQIPACLQPFDVLVCSYTLLQQEIDNLSSVQWQTIILDEAQAIKNAATKRSKAAMRLDGRFKLITTGTPIENHLGELWNLFAFINPGLLGSYKQFNRRFGIPIEKHQDKAAKKTLKKLIRPFMLRRIKADVLDELPARTEVTLRVELHPEERRFYEALRQQALENIEGQRDQSGKHIRILAEIMRLRRACCNPRLIDDTMPIASSKLQVFTEVVDELLAGGHKALVFSQFTGHLALLRDHLDARKIEYRYLDGATPARERRIQVEQFQAGKGDLFLISLKAGGLGLNLTAADYVIHMDPWWNPAVEDQAADRAHRIGQKRPVTIYRLVTADTIEEKIVRLHQEKRDLANSLLEGNDLGARMNAEELLALIRAQ